LNNYYNDQNARRSSRKQKTRRLDNSSGYSFQSDSDSAHDDDDGKVEEEADYIFDCESFPQDNKKEDDDDDALDDDASGSSHCYSDCSSVFNAPQQKNKMRRILNDDSSDDDDDNVLKVDERKDNVQSTEVDESPDTDEDILGEQHRHLSSVPLSHHSYPMLMQVQIPTMQIPTLPIYSFPIHPPSSYTPYMAPPVPYQHQYVTTQGHVPGLSVSTQDHVPDLSNKHTEKWIKKYNMLVEKSKEESFCMTRDCLSFSLYDWFNDQKRQKRARVLSPWKEQYLDSLLGSNW